MDSLQLLQIQILFYFLENNTNHEAFFTSSAGLSLCITCLTLIRAAGGVYDFQNFEEVYLCNGLTS
jgi:hypothetical protein